MKLTLLTENLQKKLSFVNHAVATRVQMPILSTILFSVISGKLTLSATDLEIGIETFVSADIEEEGVIAIPAKVFSELINTLPADKVYLETKDSSLIVSTKKTRSVFQLSPKDEFPLLYEEKGEKIFEQMPQEMSKSLSYVVFATSSETTRPALSGVYIKREEGKFLFVATDGYRLSLVSHMVKESKEEVAMIIPSRVIREALSLKENAPVSFFVSKKNNQIMLCQGESIVVGRLIDAQFPLFQKIIPSDHSVVVTFDREELLKAVKTCSIFAREVANVVTLSFKKDSITVSAKTPSLGENTVEVEGKLVGEENAISFNGKYLLDLLSIVTEETMEFSMTGPLNPGVFRIAGEDSFLHLIMPIRT